MSLEDKNYYPAKGLKGILIDGRFRVYDKKDKTKFTDYDIFHWDMEITITDSDAFIYNNKYIDYSKETLGND